jgi:hypothetical protein
MTDLEEGTGGETVFAQAWPPGQREEEHAQIDQVCLVCYLNCECDCC